MRLSVSFTNFGPYHLARLRALGRRLRDEGGDLIAYETAGLEEKYAWRADRGEEPFRRITLFPGRAVESIPASECATAMRRALARDLPDVVGIVGYVRPESLAALAWARAHRRPTVLMSESQAIDRPRAWWKEAVKRRRVGRFDAALVGGPRHRDYLIELGMPAGRIAMGYNAVDNARFARAADQARSDPASRAGLPGRPYFLSVARFAPEKNLPALVRAFARSRIERPHDWELVLCGGGPGDAEIAEAVEACGVEGAVHRPGFLQADALGRWYGHASAFVLPSTSEPWGLVANEAAACRLPLLLSERAGCAETLVPGPGTSGLRFDPCDERAMAASLAWMATRPETERLAMGRRAAEFVAAWGPERFAEGTLRAVELAVASRRRRGSTRAGRLESRRVGA